MVSETVDVVPKSGAKRGYLAVARPVELNAEVAKLTSAGVTGALDYGESSVPVGKPGPNAETDVFPIAGLEMKVMLHAVVPPLSGGRIMALAVGGGAGALVGMICSSPGSSPASAETSGATPPSSACLRWPAARSSGSPPALHSPRIRAGRS